MPNAKCQMLKGFTLIELLVVVAVIGLLAVGALVNVGGFRQNKSLDNSAADLRGYFRTAQNHAVSGVFCVGTTPSASWLISLKTITNVTLECTTNPMPTPVPAVRSLNFVNNVQVVSVKGNGLNTCLGSLPVKITFTPVTGSIQFSDSINQACIKDSTRLVITLVDTLTNNNKFVTINKGGAIDVR